ncbi:hypothetical protein R6Q59_010291 [Mikania micrantha]
MAKSFLLLLLKFLMILLAIVWASIWVMKPTQIWTRKWKEAEEAARTTTKVAEFDLIFVESDHRESFVGVLSAMEVVVIFIFIIFLAWSFYVRVSNDFKKMMPAKSLMKLTTWQYMMFRSATRFGLLAEACLALLLFPIMRGVTVFQLFGIQFETSVRYHIWLGTMMLSFATLHGAGTLFIWGIKNMLQDEVNF